MEQFPHIQVIFNDKDFLSHRGGTLQLRFIQAARPNSISQVAESKKRYAGLCGAGGDWMKDRRAALSANPANRAGPEMPSSRLQQILGNCSPASISTMRVPPNPVTIETMPRGSLLTSPMMQASRP